MTKQIRSVYPNLAFRNIVLSLFLFRSDWTLAARGGARIEIHAIPCLHCTLASSGTGSFSRTSSALIAFANSSNGLAPRR